MNLHKYKLNADYVPMGDQVKAIEYLTNNINNGVKEQILAFDAGTIKPGLLKKVNKLLKAKGANFEHERISKVSRAAAPMAMWVKSSCRYALVMERIEPLNSILSIC